MDLGKNIETSVVDEIIDAQKPEQCALLIYTVSSFICHNLLWDFFLFPIVRYNWKPKGSDA